MSIGTRQNHSENTGGFPSKTQWPSGTIPWNSESLYTVLQNPMPQKPRSPLYYPDSSFSAWTK